MEGPLEVPSPRLEAGEALESCTHSEAPGAEGSLLVLAWPPPRCCSLLHYSPATGIAHAVELSFPPDVQKQPPASDRHRRGAQASLQGECPSLSEAVGTALASGESAAWALPWGKGFDHTLALLATNPEELFVVQVSCQEDGHLLELQALRSAGGRSLPSSRRLLQTRLPPLPSQEGTASKATHCCLANCNATGGLKLLRYCADTGATSLDSLEEGPQGWAAKPLRALSLTPNRDVRILPNCIVPPGFTVVLQYGVTTGDAVVKAVGPGTTGRDAERWRRFWVSGYPNQQITSCLQPRGSSLVEYKGQDQRLNIGRFDENGNYNDEWWISFGGLPFAKMLGFWPRPPPDAGHHDPDAGGFAVLQYDVSRGAAEQGLIFVALPRNVGINAPRRHRWACRLSGEPATELAKAVREAHWRQRQAALLLSVSRHGPRIEDGALAGLIGILRELMAEHVGLWRKVLLML